MCVQPASMYYTWQVEVMINNFIKNNISANDIHIICSIKNKIPIEWYKMQDKYTDVNFFFYEDTRKNPVYISSIRPHILKKHFEMYPELKYETIFYHDCDIVFIQPYNFSKFMRDEIWYASDTRFYVGSDYIKSKKFGIYEKMCKIVGIDQSVPEKNELNSGGAQYIMKNIDHTYWEKVERDSESLYSYFLEHLEKHPETPEYHPIQKWTADMWAVLWNAWYFGHELKVDPDLEFAWPTFSYKDLSKYYIFHNAGILASQSDKKFFKGDYINKLPYNISNFVDKDDASHFYLNEIIETGKKSCLI